jgi:hypothetical protein
MMRARLALAGPSAPLPLVGLVVAMFHEPPDFILTSTSPAEQELLADSTRTRDAEGAFYLFMENVEE